MFFYIENSSERAGSASEGGLDKEVNQMISIIIIFIYSTFDKSELTRLHRHFLLKDSFVNVGLLISLSSSFEVAYNYHELLRND